MVYQNRDSMTQLHFEILANCIIGNIHNSVMVNGEQTNIEVKNVIIENEQVVIVVEDLLDEGFLYNFTASQYNHIRFDMPVQSPKI